MSIRADIRLSGAGQTPLLDVNLAFPESGVTAVIGPSGAGKTLLLRSLAGLESPTGTIHVAGQTWLNESHSVPAHLRRVGYVSQAPGLLPHLSVRENLEFARSRRGESAATRPALAHLSIEQAADLTGITPLLERQPTKLSGGEAQRVAIARAMLRAPDLLLLDEPVSALDPERREAILQLLSRVLRTTGVPALYVTHRLSEVARLADHLALLEGGKITASGPLAQILTRLDLPLAHKGDAESVLDGHIEGYNNEHRVLSVNTEAGLFSVTGDGVELGKPVRLRIAARDVSIALEKPGQSSILNVVPATVQAIHAGGPHRAVIQLEAGAAPVLAHISHLSLDRLGLTDHQSVYLQVKGIALLSQE